MNIERIDLYKRELSIDDISTRVKQEFQKPHS